MAWREAEVFPANYKTGFLVCVCCVASLVTIGGVVGTLSGGLLSDLFGRKHTIMMSSLIFFMGWLFIGFAESVVSILVGRLLTGIASGLYSASVQVRSVIRNQNNAARQEEEPFDNTM